MPFFCHLIPIALVAQVGMGEEQGNKEMTRYQECWTGRCPWFVFCSSYLELVSLRYKAEIVVIITSILVFKSLCADTSLHWHKTLLGVWCLGFYLGYVTVGVYRFVVFVSGQDAAFKCTTSTILQWCHIKTGA